MSDRYLAETLTRAEADELPGVTVLQFGTDWCGYCQAAEPLIDAALGGVEGRRRVLVEDGPGRPLGRSYRVKLWPTVIVLNNGVEVARVVRPRGGEDLADAVAKIGQASESTR
ncbi:thioredoxin family protein [Propionicimonas sp.]|uniref:thioredoxin family protein n=1 Tax=Propionicimonas sp. TaxID=1955623 RepID=UPI0017A386E8|nr:thioredoxin family protein [Propionicimonas sp.]MBU3976306.1 thioredoxin family protein [Actinomycetota bacterium]MBA3022101.1 thioredoxin family protein [Propionicimonas sp.]MBU3987463.1 thioredoxin family protein [Actinomycetota bacterium]MBU4006592.1 thioredoxin family protein [Actinomycetota bacterium]MBU4065197.1 thioredoxin family protein [Actinomycetota bacterium]